MGKRLITRRGIKKGWSQEQIDKAVDDREATKNKIKAGLAGFGGVLQPIVETAISIVPGAGMLSRVAAKLPVVSKFPIIKTVVDEGASQFDLKVKTSGGAVAVAQDIFLPAQEAYANGEYGKMALQLGVLVAAGVIAVIVYL